MKVLDKIGQKVAKDMVERSIQETLAKGLTSNSADAKSALRRNARVGATKMGRATKTTGNR